ncbi:hypothetical protein [Kitasatospora sp. P5_F3]
MREIWGRTRSVWIAALDQDAEAPELVVKNEAGVRRLSRVLEVGPPESVPWMGWGELRVGLLGGGGELLVGITMHLAGGLSSELWPEQRSLLHPEEWVDWLRAQRMLFPDRPEVRTLGRQRLWGAAPNLDLVVAGTDVLRLVSGAATPERARWFVEVLTEMGLTYRQAVP